MVDAIVSLPNLGPWISKRLAEVGVHDADDLRALGAVEAYARLRFHFGREVSLNALWAIDAALSGKDWRLLPDERKTELKALPGPGV